VILVVESPRRPGRRRHEGWRRRHQGRRRAVWYSRHRGFFPCHWRRRPCDGRACHCRRTAVAWRLHNRWHVRRHTAAATHWHTRRQASMRARGHWVRWRREGGRVWCAWGWERSRHPDAESGGVRWREGADSRWLCLHGWQRCQGTRSLSCVRCSPLTRRTHSIAVANSRRAGAYPRSSVTGGRRGALGGLEQGLDGLKCVHHIGIVALPATISGSTFSLCTRHWQRKRGCVRHMWHMWPHLSNRTHDRRCVRHARPLGGLGDGS
jgi:hypothetical protein